MLTSIYKTLAVLLVGFAGGALSPWVFGWIKKVAVDAPSDAVAIANTYIVFTTIIFVGVTVILAIAGYVFTQQFSETKQSQSHRLCDELKKKIESNEQVAIVLASAMLENPDVSRHLMQQLNIKVDALIQERVTESQAAAKEATHQAEATKALASQILRNGDQS